MARNSHRGSIRHSRRDRNSASGCRRLARVAHSNETRSCRTAGHRRIDLRGCLSFPSHSGPNFPTPSGAGKRLERLPVRRLLKTVRTNSRFGRWRPGLEPEMDNSRNRNPAERDICFSQCRIAPPRFISIITHSLTKGIHDGNSH